ncbi:MAG: ISNCY family transposase [Nitrospirota bacterium]
MAEQDKILMSQREANRFYVIRQAIDKKITQRQAAELLHRGERQIRRLVRRVRTEGNAGICHKSRGKRSHNGIREKIKNKVITLCGTTYREFGPTHAHEKLLAIHKIKISDETLRGWFQQEDLPYKKRKKRPHREWRKRKEHRGEMVQMDGSHHDWFERRGPSCVLMGLVDDATGEVYARFYEYEGTIPALDSFKRYGKRYGLPQSVYVDRHTTYKSTAVSTIYEELHDIKPMSDFQKSLDLLGVTVIYAYSPQAKGRIERVFETFQDRVVKEMRLAGVKNITEGNAFLDGYLPEYNRMFAKEPLKKADFHGPITNKRALDEILSIKTKRALRNDFTVAHNKVLYQITSNIRAKHVMVEERTDGSMRILHNKQRLKYTVIDVRPQKQETRTKKFRIQRVCKPSGMHPWRSPGKAMVSARIQRQTAIQNRTF